MEPEVLPLSDEVDENEYVCPSELFELEFEFELLDVELLVEELELEVPPEDDMEDVVFDDLDFN
jgi:hypothetical protein